MMPAQAPQATDAAGSGSMPVASTPAGGVAHAPPAAAHGRDGPTSYTGATKADGCCCEDNLARLARIFWGVMLLASIVVMFFAGSIKDLAIESQEKVRDLGWVAVAVWMPMYVLIACGLPANTVSCVMAGLFYGDAPCRVLLNPTSNPLPAALC